MLIYFLPSLDGCDGLLERISSRSTCFGWQREQLTFLCSRQDLRVLEGVLDSKIVLFYLIIIINDQHQKFVMENAVEMLDREQSFRAHPLMFVRHLVSVESYPFSFHVCDDLCRQQS